LVCACAPCILAGEASTDDLIKQLQGEAKMTPQELEGAYAKVLDSLMPAMGSDNAAERSKPQQTFQGLCWHAGRPGADAERAAVCKVIAARLAKDMPKPACVFLLSQLERIGTAESVNAAAALLADKDALVRESARRALQNNPAPEAANTLRAALGKADSPEWRVGLINALGARRDEASLKVLIQQAGTDDEAVRTAAVEALARIGDKSAADVVTAAMSKGSDRAKGIATDAYLLLADRLCEKGDKATALPMYKKLLGASGHVKCAAIIGTGRAGGVAELPVIFDALADKDAKVRGAAISALVLMPGKEVTQAIAEKAKTAPPEMKAALLGVFVQRGDKTSLPIFIASATDPDEMVRIAAIEGMGKLGDEGATPTLLTVLMKTEGRERDAAQASLNRIPGDATTNAIIKAMGGADAKARVELLKCVAVRKSPDVLPTVVKAAEDPDAALRLEALKALAVIADEKTLPSLVRMLVAAKDQGERDAAEKAVVSTCLRVQDTEKRAEPVLAALPGANDTTRPVLMRVLGRIGGKKSLDTLRAALKAPKPEVQDAAIRALAEWPDATVAGDLVEIAGNSPNEPHRVVALRGYVRVVGLPSPRSAQQTLKLYQDGMAAARRPDDKKLVLAGLAEVKDIGALKLVEPCLDEPATKNEAASAATKIARAVGGDQTLPILKKVLAVAQDNNVCRDAASAAVRIVEKFPADRKQEVLDVCEAALKVKGLDKRVVDRCNELLKKAGAK
jgi:HEAT repeat protein